MSESEEEDITIEDDTTEDSEDQLEEEEPSVELSTTNHSVAGFPDSSEESSDSEEETLQKFDREVITDYISLYHPETKMHNDEEISALSVITRNQYGDVIDPAFIILHLSLLNLKRLKY